MRIKELEYGELRTIDYNNFRVVMRIELEDDEDLDKAFEDLKSKVREKLAKVIAEEDPYTTYLAQNKRELENQVEILREQKKQLIDEILTTLKYKFTEIFRP